MPFVPDKPGTGRFVPDRPFTGRPEDEILSAPLDTLQSRPDTPRPSLLQRAGAYAKDYGRGILNAASGVRPGEEVAGGAEALLSMATGAVAPLSAAAGTLMGDREVSPEEFTYQPRTQTGRAALDTLGAVAKPLSDSGLDVAFGPLMNEAGAVSRVPRRVPPPTAEEVVSRLEASPQSVGAASSSSAASIAGASPPLQQAVVRLATKKGPQAINPDVLARHAEADSLPVPVRLTEGQATRDPNIYSIEMNARAKDKASAAHYGEQEKQLGENLQAMRDEAGPDVFTTNATEHGDTLVSAYKAKDAAAEAEINAAYAAARDANGGDLPMNGKAFVSAADAALKKSMKGRYVPSEIAADLAEIRDSGSMSFETFENMRTNLAAEARKAERAGDGNATGAIRIVRDALESIEPTGAAVEVKPLFDKARRLARSRFSSLDADPAYKAVVDEKIQPDHFVRRFVINGTRDKVALMRKNLADDLTASQTISTATVDHLRQAAGLDNLGNGRFAQARYNKALNALDPKMRDLVSAQVAETLRKIGNVGRNIQERPAGGYVNESNTFTAAAGEMAKSGAEQAVNAAFKGLPVGTAARGIFGRRSAFKRATKPGAGLDYQPLTRQQLLAERLKK